MKIVSGAKVSYGFDNIIRRTDSPEFRLAVRQNMDEVSQLFHLKKLQDYFDGDKYIFTRNDRRNYKQIDLLITDKEGKTTRQPVYGTDAKYPPPHMVFIESIFARLYLKSGDKSWFKGSFMEMFINHVYGKKKN